MLRILLIVSLVKLIWCWFVAKIFAGKVSKDYDASSLTVAASDKVLVPGSNGEGTSSFTDQLETPETVSEEEVCDVL